MKAHVLQLYQGQVLPYWNIYNNNYHCCLIIILIIIIIKVFVRCKILSIETILSTSIIYVINIMRLSLTSWWLDYWMDNSEAESATVAGTG